MTDSVNFHQLTVALDRNMDHLWVHPSKVDEDTMLLDIKPDTLFAIKPGQFCLVKTMNNFGSVCFSSFVTKVTRRRINSDIEDQYDKLHVPVEITFHNDNTFTFLDSIMLFEVDCNGILQHASLGHWLGQPEIYGNPSRLCEGSWTRASPKYNRISLPPKLAILVYTPPTPSCA